MRRWITAVLLLALMAFAALWLRDFVRRHPQDVRWTQLDLRHDIGMFTGTKIAGLGDEPEQCRALLTQAGVGYTSLPARSAGANCGYDEAVRPLDGAGIDYRPSGLGVRCAVAAGLAVWQREVVQPAAARHLGSRVTSIDHFGSYSCRRVNARAEGRWSEHATANAVDIAGFRLADGQRIRIVADWNEDGSEAAFLREVRDGACSLFATTLSPDYNAAHRDHLHLDQAARGASGGRLCR